MVRRNQKMAFTRKYFSARIFRSTGIDAYRSNTFTSICLVNDKLLPPPVLLEVHVPATT